MLTHCPLTGVYLPRFIPAVLAGFVFLFAYEWALHGVLLMDIYLQTPNLWRTPEDMTALFPFQLLGQFALTFVSALLFTRHYEAKGVMEGVRFGGWLGLVFGVMMASSFVWMPISGTLAVAWFVGGLLQGVGLGVIFALLYRKGACCDKGSCCSK